MGRVSIIYSLSYDWLVRGRPDEDCRPVYDRGLRYQAAARAHWEPFDQAIFDAFQAFGLQFWEVWPAYPVHLPKGTNAFKDPLTFAISEDWDDVRTVLVHELCHLHEDHPGNVATYHATLEHIREVLPNEDEGVQYHVITCVLQEAVLRHAFPDKWRSMIGTAFDHPILHRAWELIDQRAAAIDWRDPIRSMAHW